MVDARDQRGKRDAQKIAEKGHQRLKAAEPDADGECLFHTAATYGEAFTDGYGKSVHRQTDSQKE